MVGLKAAVGEMKPFPHKHHQKVHLHWVNLHKNSAIDDWKEIVWSDMTKINHLVYDGRKWM